MFTRARKPLALAAMAVLLASCADSATSGPVASRPLETSTIARPIELPPAPAWTAAPTEAAPNAKTAATRLVQAVGTYPLGGGTLAAATERLRGAGFAGELAGQFGPLLVPDAASSAAIVYPQLGGYEADAASVIVVTRQSLRTRRGDEVVTRTIDIALTLVAGQWQPTAVGSTGGAPPAVGALPAPANVTALLADKRVELPDSARWDLQAGRVDARIVDLLLRLASTRRLAVTVLTTGHPHNVFATDRVSNHTAGRGVDIWAIDGTPVVASRQVGSPVEQLVRQLLAEGVTEVGSPFNVDGPGGASFTNLVHQDHLHLAYKR